MNKYNREYLEIACKQHEYKEDTKWIVVQLLNIEEKVSSLGKTISILLVLIIILSIIALFHFW